ncbi:MAG: nitrilase family protein [Roseovarius sp.]|jgi:N-carbamoylputrescine amidase|nr:nitrilase family protein [Roseovarius sp.]
MHKMLESKVVVACLQFDPHVGLAERNIALGLDMIEQAADRGANLIVLPELSDSGYVFESRQEAYGLASIAGSSPSLLAWAKIAKARGLHIVGGFCERDGDALYNSAALIGPDGLLGVYRKAHLWGAENLFFERGNVGFPVFTTPIGRISALICYDGWFPEAWRLCALQGADIVCVPTNWVPMPSQPDNLPAMSNILCMAAAHSNSMFVAAACRTGVERGQPFIGQSLIVNHEGWPIAGPAGFDEATILLAECNLSDARRKRSLNEFNQVVRDRRADLYGEMLGSNAPPNWY